MDLHSVRLVGAVIVGVACGGGGGGETTAPPVPTRYVVTAIPANIPAATQSQVTAQLVDAKGQPYAHAGRVVTWSWVVTHGPANAVFAQETSTTDFQGIARNSFLGGFLAGVSYTLSVTDDGLPQKTSSTDVVVVAGPTTRYSVWPATPSVTAGAPVIIYASSADFYQNLTPLPGRVVTWQVTDGVGTFSQPTSTTDANGLASVTYTPAPTAMFHEITVHDSQGLTGRTEPFLAQ